MFLPNGKETAVRPGDLICVSRAAQVFVRRNGCPLELGDGQYALNCHKPIDVELTHALGVTVSKNTTQPLGYGHFLASAVASIAGLKIEESFTMDDHENFQYRVIAPE